MLGRSYCFIGLDCGKDQKSNRGAPCPRGIMAEVEQPLQKRPRVEEITTSGKTVTPTTKMGDISALTVRPKQRGTLGNPIAAISNQYLLRIASETQFFLYEADIKEKYARENDPVGLTKVRDLECQ